MNTAVPLKTVKAEPLRLPEHRDAYYGGGWHAPKSGRYVDSINPGTSESLGPVANFCRYRCRSGCGEESL